MIAYHLESWWIYLLV